MLTPEGLSANRTDKIMLLVMWANAIHLENSKLELSKIQKNK